MLLKKTKYWQLIEKMQQLSDEKVVNTSIEENLDYIVELNLEQLSNAEYVSGNKLPEYSDVSKEVFDKPDGGMTLEDTGKYYASFRALLSSDGELINLFSNPIKFDKGITTNLEVKYGSNYGEEIKGLNEENIGIIQKEVKKEILIKIRRILFKS